mgnify:CR=1 FL=1
MENLVNKIVNFNGLSIVKLTRLAVSLISQFFQNCDLSVVRLQVFLFELLWQKTALERSDKLGLKTYIFQDHLTVIIRCDEKDASLGTLLLSTAKTNILMEEVW